jgi:putative phosphoribosyl transferase
MKRAVVTEATLVRVPAGSVTLEGDLQVPDHATGVVLFAHGSGSGRHSTRNQFVARQFQSLSLATLLIDLLTSQEEGVDQYTAHLRFDIPLLAERLVATTHWLGDAPATRVLPVGYFGASTGGGAALMAAAQEPDRVSAVVSRGGRPDLAADSLLLVRAPTLLIVGGQDFTVLDLNRAAMARMRAETRLEVVPGATHLFEEPGALETVAHLAGNWFLRHLNP